MKAGMDDSACLPLVYSYKLLQSYLLNVIQLYSFSMVLRVPSNQVEMKQQGLRFQAS